MNEVSIPDLTRIKRGLKLYLEQLLIMDENEFPETIVNTSSPALPNEIRQTRALIQDFSIILDRKKLNSTY
jgi:hypothetical protein